MMRLTLRTLLAHEHGLLNETQTALISEKIEQSPFVTQLLRHLRDRTQRREIVPFSLETRGLAALTNIVRYLDHELPADRVVSLENECFGSDRMLAEVAACHEILARWLAMPTAVEPGLRRRLYEVIPSASRTESAPLEQTPPWTALPAAVSAPMQETRNLPAAQRQTATSRKSPARKRTLLAGLSLAATVAVMVTFGVEYRERFETLLERHLRNQVTQQFVPALEESPPRPESFFVGTPSWEPLEKPPRDMPADIEPAMAVPEVATTAFHVPLDRNEPSAAERDDLKSEWSGGQWKVENSQAAFWLPADDAQDTFLYPGLKSTEVPAGARLVVAPRGKCALVQNSGRLAAFGPAELRWETKESIKFRYGQVTWAPGDGENMILNTAGQTIRVEESSKDVQLRLTTAAVEIDGVNYARDTANQEVWIECLVGTAKLGLSSCQGTLMLEEGEVLVAHPTAGVRSEELANAPRAVEALQGSSEFSENQRAEPDAPGEMLASLRKRVQVAPWEDAIFAREALAQMDYWEELIALWNHELAAEVFAEHATRIRGILAQDQDLAIRLEETVSQVYPEHGPLVFRLICGFSEDQRSEITIDQLRSLTQHPQNSVRQWAAYQVAQGITTP